jgi:predicted ATPase
VQSGGIDGLPDSAESAAMARIDALAPEDRALVRRASVFGLTFHPRMLEWLAAEEGASPPDTSTWERLRQLFDAEPDGYMRFRRSLLRDAAYEGLPYKLRRKLHGTVAARIAQEADDPDEVSGILSLHYLVAGDNRSAFRYANVAGKRAVGVYAYVEAARLYARALEAGRRLDDVSAQEIAGVQRDLGDAWYQTAEFKKAADAYTAARKLVASDPLPNADLLLKFSFVETKLGRPEKALRWIKRARAALSGVEGQEAARVPGTPRFCNSVAGQRRRSGGQSVLWPRQKLPTIRRCLAVRSSRSDWRTANSARRVQFRSFNVRWRRFSAGGTW